MRGLSGPVDAGKTIQIHASGNALLTTDKDGKRITGRRRMLKAGIVAFNNGHSTLQCTVRNLPETGAQLRLDGSIGAPDTFERRIEIDGLEADCEVVWRKTNELGVRFVSAPQRVAPRRTQVMTAVAPARTPSLRRKPKPGNGT